MLMVVLLVFAVILYEQRMAISIENRDPFSGQLPGSYFYLHGFYFWELGCCLTWNDFR